MVLDGAVVEGAGGDAVLEAGCEGIGDGLSGCAIGTCKASC